MPGSPCLSPLLMMFSRLKSSLAALEGEAEGQAKGETLQLQNVIRQLTTQAKFDKAETQKLRNVLCPHSVAYT